MACGLLSGGRDRRWWNGLRRRWCWWRCWSVERCYSWMLRWQKPWRKINARFFRDCKCRSYRTNNLVLLEIILFTR
uniref:Uncharacterized protein n=1 Tax=Arundo donax TaxID=35708 RepID=A0A0A9B8D7_ARUDO